MALISPVRGREDTRTRGDAIAQLRDVGERLKHVLVRYDRLVTRVTDGPVPAHDLIGRVDWLTLQLAATAEQLQEIIVLEGEHARAVPIKRSPARADATRRRFVVHRFGEGRV